ncbi:MAG: MATE family efflux transporter [Oscillospiraceae bacterium]|nr:MATE family efflux transporter [Oscillospiraceae bacterium]
MTKDMTKGRPLLLILGFCIPMVFRNILQQFYNLADTAIVGQCLNSDALAAIGLTGAVCFLVVGFAMGLCTGLSIPVAQAYGAGDMKLMRKYMTNAVYIASAVCVVLTVATLVYCRPLLRLMDTPEDILDMSASYLYVIFAGLAATILYNLLAGFLRAMGDSTTPLIFLAVSSVLNIGLDFLMILVFHLGVMGAGLATVLAQGISAVCCLYYMYRKFPVLTFERDEFAIRPEHVAKLCGISLPMAFQFSITAIGTIILQTAINGFGPDIIASVSTAQKIQNVVCGPMESMGITMATYCGQNLGAGRIDRIRQGLRSSNLTALAYSVLAYLFNYFLGQYFVYLFLSKNDPAFAVILEYAVRYLKICGLFYPLLAVLFVLRNSLQGMGYSFLPMSAGIVELAARVFAVGVLVSAYGFVGISLASPVAWVAADVLLISATVWAMAKLSRRVPDGAVQRL